MFTKQTMVLVKTEINYVQILKYLAFDSYGNEFNAVSCETLFSVLSQSCGCWVISSDDC